MKIEHFAYQLSDAQAAANWYQEQLGFQVRRGTGKPFPVYFLADQSGDVMIEIYSNPSVQTPAYSDMDPLILHLAFVCDDVPATIERLQNKGAQLLSGPDSLENGDILAMMRDPWGLAIQLCYRGKAML